jgi:hypothetical protein
MGLKSKRAPRIVSAPVGRKQVCFFKAKHRYDRPASWNLWPGATGAGARRDTHAPRNAPSATESEVEHALHLQASRRLHLAAGGEGRGERWGTRRGLVEIHFEQAAVGNPGWLAFLRWRPGDAVTSGAAPLPVENIFALKDVPAWFDQHADQDTSIWIHRRDKNDGEERAAFQGTSLHAV